MKYNLKKHRLKRVRRIRAKVKTVAVRPRLTVFRSNQWIYAQVIDDSKGKTLAAASEREIKPEAKATKVEKAKLVGELVADRAIKNKVKQVVFDRGAYKFHGRVKALATGAREKGLQF